MSPQATLLVTLPQDQDTEFKCGKCGAEVPEHLVVCWNCGECIDPRIKRLAAKEAGK